MFGKEQSTILFRWTRFVQTGSFSIVFGTKVPLFSLILFWCVMKFWICFLNYFFILEIWLQNWNDMLFFVIVDVNTTCRCCVAPQSIVISHLTSNSTLVYFRNDWMLVLLWRNFWRCFILLITLNQVCWESALNLFVVVVVTSSRRSTLDRFVVEVDVDMKMGGVVVVPFAPFLPIGGWLHWDFSSPSASFSLIFVWDVSLWPSITWRTPVCSLEGVPPT